MKSIAKSVLISVGIISGALPVFSQETKENFTHESDVQTFTFSRGKSEDEVLMIARAYRQVWIKQKVETEYERLECDTRRDTWPEEWKNYENLSNEGKARIFSDLAFHIPYTAALDMINRGHFKTRPWTWNEFDEKLYLADQYWYYVGVVQNGRDLVKRMGYLDTKCHWVFGVFIDRVYLPQPKQRALEKDIEKKIKIRVTGSDFLPSEQDRLEVTFDGERIIVRDRSKIHVYGAPELVADGEYVLPVRERRLMTNTWENASVKWESSGRTMLLTFADSYFDELSREGEYKVTLNFKLMRKRSFRSDKEEYRNSIDITMRETEIDFEKYIRSKEEYYVVVSYDRRRTKYFDSRESSSLTTQTLKAR